MDMLKTHGIAVSMTSHGRPHENVLAERVNGILKQEYGLGNVIKYEGKAHQLAAGVPVDKATASYNGKRPHVSTQNHSLRGQTPEQVHGVAY